VVGIDNDMRSVFFGPEASTARTRWRLEDTLGSAYRHHDLDLRERDAIDALFRTYGTAIELVVHATAQPSHDWAAREPFTDCDINPVGTLSLLEATRLRAPEATFIFTSTNKVYGDTPNRLPLVELDTCWALPQRVRSRGDPAQRGDHRRAARLDVRGAQPDRRPYLVDRRPTAASSRITRTGRSSTTSGGSSRRCTKRTPSAGAREVRAR
jgi:NAD dependent epimerase/dehydratase family